ncbi:hypothetical protein OTK49_20780 [Vibrio coralliirubri]|uniref:hypothetical protein n=1 Tax=Vibrio coralliirubri TaxID=1516159 RepID=UPI002284A641|nr:hypothetical protein [Vibrio coralliirubri]MCY9864954.1 hypothetical protein [Vibrio coralliirubri]
MQDPDIGDDFNQSLKNNNQALPFDLGAQAYHDRKMPEANPYDESDWRNEEWWKGWSCAEEGDSLQMFDHVVHAFRDSPLEKSHPWG